MVNKPAIVLGAIAAVSIGFASLFYIRYVNRSDQYKALQKEKEAAVAKASEYGLISSTLLRQVGDLSREKEEAARQSQIRREDLEKALRAADVEKSKVSELEVKASGLETRALNLQKQLTDSKAEADKYKEEHKYPNSVVDELNKELQGICVGDLPKDDQFRELFGLLAIIEPYIESRVRAFYKDNTLKIDKEFVSIYLKDLEHAVKHISYKKFAYFKDIKKRTLLSTKILKLMLEIGK